MGAENRDLHRGQQRVDLSVVVADARGWFVEELDGACDPGAGDPVQLTRLDTLPDIAVGLDRVDEARGVECEMQGDGVSAIVRNACRRMLRGRGRFVAERDVIRVDAVVE